jgi:serine protease
MFEPAEHEEPPTHPRERASVVVRFMPGMGLSRAPTPEELIRLEGWREVFAAFPELRLNCIFSEEALQSLDSLVQRARRADPQFEPADFGAFFYAHWPAETQRELQRLLAEIRRCADVQRAYLECPGPDCSSAPPTNFLPDQGYLRPAPEGIDAFFANDNGGDGAGQRLIDVERGWTLDHRDLASLEIPLLQGGIRRSSRPHGTSVLGILCGQHEGGLGCRGIVPGLRGISVLAYDTQGGRSGAIAIAAALLDPGDTLLLEAQEQLHGVSVGEDQLDLLAPLEVCDADLQVIRTATTAGVIVVEPAGNGNGRFGAHLDLDAYADEFGRKPLDCSSPDFSDSGAILVSAAHAVGSHEPIAYATRGNRIDCYAWGEGITTCTSDQDGTDTVAYTPAFGGTSGASAIIAGCAVAVQGMLAARNRQRLTPKEMRTLLRDATRGTVPHGGPGIIGVMPDLRRVLE